MPSVVDIRKKLLSFTHPKKREEKKTRAKSARKRKVHIQRDEALSQQLAVHVFNSVPDVQTLSLWAPEVLCLPEDQARRLPSSTIAYEHIVGVGGSMCCVLDFIMGAGVCAQWLQEELHNIGWQCNMTGFNPISSSHSTVELLRSTMACRDMAKKQMALYLAHSDAATRCPNCSILCRECTTSAK
jgi:hypothetical protein